MINENEAKLKCLRWIEAMTMASPECFDQSLTEWIVDDANGNETCVIRWACFSGDSFGFSQEFRGQEWSGLLQVMETCDSPEGPGTYVHDWENRHRDGLTLAQLLECEPWAGMEDEE